MTPPRVDNFIVSQAGIWERTPSYPPTPGNFGRERTSSEYSFCHFGEHSQARAQSQSRQSRLIDNLDSGNGATDNEYPDYMPYIIEWKVTLNNRTLIKDTEQDLRSNPCSYWQGIIQKAERLLRQKINRDRRVRLDDTVFVVSVNDRLRDFTKRFEKTDIDWALINRQILLRQELLHQPKKMLTISISINYMEDTNLPSNGTDKRGNEAERIRHAPSGRQGTKAD